jgi:hypothetical protein
MITKKEEEWFKKFYEGTVFVKGWKYHMNDMLQKVPADEKEKIRGLLDDFGKKIGYEWAKDNNVRKIDTATLQKWGNDLRTAGEKGPEALIEKISLLDSAADSILS